MDEAANALAAERESCARIAEWHSDENGYDGLTARLIAEGIRARKAQTWPASSAK